MTQLSLSVVKSLTEVPQAEWDALAVPASPFLEWDWLAGLEDTGCARAECGWAPHHLLLREDGKLVAGCPLYLKGNSEGEFVFDHEWAHAAHSAGIQYYPKLLVAVPFTPATGPRLLIDPAITEPGRRAAIMQALGRALLEICQGNDLSSVHVNFCVEEEAQALAPLGFVERQGLQYHWENRGYRDFEDFLESFRSKRRNQIRRERRELEQQGVRVRAVVGDEIGLELSDTMYRLYQGHIEKLYWGRLYLNRDFFDRIVQRFRRNLCFVLAERGGEVIAGTFNVQNHGVFYGRYWGAFEDVKFLHFNVCYYGAVEHCIRTGLKRMEPGAGGDFKQTRGFDARLTRSLHHFTHTGMQDAVGQYLKRERQHFQRVIAARNEDSELKPLSEDPE